MSRTWKRVACISAATVVAMSASVGVASAGISQFMGAQGLSAGNAYADGNVFRYINNVHVYSDHTICPAVGSGYGGYTSTPFSGGNNTGYYPAQCGYGDIWGSFNPVSSNLHGAVYNPNGATYDNISWAFVYFD